MHCLLLYVGARALYSKIAIQGAPRTSVRVLAHWCASTGRGEGAELIWEFMWAPPFPFQFAMISMMLQLYIFFVGSWLVRRFTAEIRGVFPQCRLHAAGPGGGEQLLNNAYMLGGVLLGAGAPEGRSRLQRGFWGCTKNS